MFNRKALFVSLMMWVSNIDSQAMVRVNDDYDLSYRSPIKHWKYVDDYTGEALAVYNSTWNSELDLDKNRELLIKRFMNTCCDMSFKYKSTGIDGVYIGSWDSDSEGDGNLIFIANTICLSLNHDKTKVELYKSLNDVIEVPLTAPILKYMRPLDFKDCYKKKIESWLQEITSDAVGCALLRKTIVSFATTTNSEKIRFIPVRKGGKQILYSRGRSAYTYLSSYEKEQPSVANAVHGLRCKQKYILFNPEPAIHNPQHDTVVAKCDQYRKLYYFEIIKNFPDDAILFTQILRAMLDRGVSVNIKEERIDLYANSNEYKKYTCVDTDNLGEVCTTINKIYPVVYPNEKTYRAMWGVRVGCRLDVISEAGYMRNKYKYVRAFDVSSLTSFVLQKEEVLEGEYIDRQHKLIGDEMLDYVKRFAVAYADYDLIRFYLHPASNIQIPQFIRRSYVNND